jgi:hypothetical protein
VGVHLDEKNKEDKVPEDIIRQYGIHKVYSELLSIKFGTRFRGFIEDKERIQNLKKLKSYGERHKLW